MKIISILSMLLLLVLLSGCSGIQNEEKYTFSTGRYILELDWQDRPAYRIDTFIDNSSGVLNFLSPYNDKTYISGIVENSRFTASVHDNDTNVLYRGELTSDNHIDGKMSGRIYKYDTRAHAAGAPVETVPGNGTFRIYPYNVKSIRETMSFLPTVTAPKYFLPRLYDPRTYAFILDSDGNPGDFKDLVYNVSGNIIISYKKRPLSCQQLADNIKKTTELYGSDIPIEIYADKNATLLSLHKVLQVCNKAGVYRFFLRALQQQRGEALYRFPIALYEENNSHGEHEINITLKKKSILADNKIQDNPDDFLKNEQQKHPMQIIVINYDDNITVQELVSFIALCAKHKFTQLGLRNRETNSEKE